MVVGLYVPHIMLHVLVGLGFGWLDSYPFKSLLVEVW